MSANFTYNKKHDYFSLDYFMKNVFFLKEITTFKNFLSFCPSFGECSESKNNIKFD